MASGNDGNPVEKFFYTSVGFGKMLDFVNGERPEGVGPARFFRGTYMGDPMPNSRLLVVAPDTGAKINIPLIPRFKGMSEFIVESIRYRKSVGLSLSDKELERGDLPYAFVLSGRLRRWGVDTIERLFHESIDRYFPDATKTVDRTVGRYEFRADTPSLEVRFVGGSSARFSRNRIVLGFDLNPQELGRLKSISSKVYALRPKGDEGKK